MQVFLYLFWIVRVIIRSPHTTRKLPHKKTRMSGETCRRSVLGRAIAIDDFGTGYSSLSLLARLPIDYLKIDSGFTRTVDGSDRDRIVVRAIADLARALGLLVVAEGIENERQLARLSELGVASWQGFLKSGPVPGDQLLGLMA